LYKNIFAADREKIVQEMENKFKISEKNREIITLQAKNRQIRDRYLMMILVAALLIIIVTSFLVNYTLRNKSLKQRNKLLHNEKILREKENKLKEQEYTILKNKLETKNKELASKSLELLRYNETLRTITDKLQSVEKYVGAEHKKDLFALIKEVETFSKDNMWKEFETAFKNVHTDFYENLIEQFPDLTPSEIKLAALLRLNFSTKEIAAVTFKSESGIKSIRHRLRKKMGLESDSNLITFLLKL
jgi:DNA-binding CsgD family transcriptional regulator/predicted nucleic acid-binding Zn ribbon protein